MIVRQLSSNNRKLLGKLAFEFIVVFVGVTAAFALEGVRREREEADYRSRIVLALIPTFQDIAQHNREFEKEVQARIARFDADVAAGRKPSIPIYRERGAERPPVRIWDSVVATGAARTLEPALLFDLSTFYNRQESFGERYVRYATYTEDHILPLGQSPQGLYDPSGRLRPEFAAYVDRLRDLLMLSRNLTGQAQRLQQLLERRTDPRLHD